MATPKLSASRLVNVAVSLTPVGAVAQSLNVLLFLSTTATIDQFERFREYTSLSALALDFGTTTSAYKAAVKYFGQSPRPRKLMVGRWMRTAAAGGLRGAPLAANFQLYTAWTGITSGGFTVSVDGGGPQNVTGLNFSSATSMDAVAAIIAAGITGASCVWNDSFKRFELLSNSTGGGSSVSFLTAPGSGTDISDEMKGRAADGGYTYAGQGAESAGAVSNFFDAYYGKKWYAIAAGFESDADRLNFSAAIEAMDNKHIYSTSCTDASALVPATSTDIISQLKALGRRRTFIQYQSNDESGGGAGYSHVSAMAKLLSVNFNFANSALTLMYKREPGVPPELLNETQVGALEDKHGNVFVSYDNDTDILQRGVMTDGTFADLLMGTDALAVDVQTELYNELYTTPTKVPQTDAGMTRLTTRVEAVCSKYVNAGFLAPGVWNSDGVGAVQPGDFLPKGFYVFAPRVDSQSQTDRAQRIAVPITVLAKTAGAIHTVDVSVLVNP